MNLTIISVFVIMSIFVKELVSKIPYSFGRFLVNIPFEVRLGKDYKRFDKLIVESQTWSLDERLHYLISALNNIKQQAQIKYKFYDDLYRSFDVLDLTIKDLSDWKKLPFVDKSMLRNSLSSFDGHQKINTGGTSGEPFAFYIDKGAWAREWAHMHYIWGLKTYNYRAPKITLRGRNLKGKVYQFNPVHNEFIVNTYVSFEEKRYSKIIVDLISKYGIQYVHGYPSAVFNFFSELDRSLSFGEKKVIREHLRVCLLGSEFPLLYMTDYLDKYWNLDYISWYGHSEMCILAYDLEKKNHYRPFLTYGYAEIVEGQLVGTSFNNPDMPLIRYKTGDLVEGQEREGILEYFSIREGRLGDFVEDKNGKKVPLTALIFGRHHQAFDTFDFIQIKQDVPGKIIVLATDTKHQLISDMDSLFDFSNVDIEIDYKILKKPILSKSGKFKLKV